jgi:hypothetical protein
MARSHKKIHPFIVAHVTLYVLVHALCFSTLFQCPSRLLSVLEVLLYVLHALAQCNSPLEACGRRLQGWLKSLKGIALASGLTILCAVLLPDICDGLLNRHGYVLDDKEQPVTGVWPIVRLGEQRCFYSSRARRPVTGHQLPPDLQPVALAQ